MKRQSLDIYDDMPRAMKTYISNYGWHFSKKACEYACSKMKDRNGERIHVCNKEDVENILDKYGCKPENDILYDKVYVYNMAVADYYGSSVIDEARLARFVTDYLDDKDGCEDAAFRCYVACSVGKGEPIDWDGIL